MSAAKNILNAIHTKIYAETVDQIHDVVFLTTLLGTYFGSVMAL